MRTTLFGLAISVGIALYAIGVHVRTVEIEKNTHCIELAADIASRYPNTPYSQLPIFQQMQLQNSCGVPVH
ncbi:MAG: hypothetical protein WBQ94_26460 [Terracidiphilus sp.]